MTTHSRASLSTNYNLPPTTPPTEDDAIYTYTLRVAYLSHLIQLSTQSASTPLPPPLLTVNTNPNARPGFKSSTSFRPTEGWTEKLSSLVKDSKSDVRYPKELIRVLDTKIGRILALKGMGYRSNNMASSSTPLEIELGSRGDERLLTSLKIFKISCLGNNEQTFRKLKEHRKIEELIMEYVKIASEVARSPTTSNSLSPPGGGDDWQMILNRLVGDFVNLIKDSLKSKEVGKVSAELYTRLDNYCESLTPPPSGSASSSMSNEGRSNGLSGSRDSTSSTNIMEMELVLAVGKLFGRSDSELQKDVLGIRRICTEKAAYRDLKVCINNLAQGARFPASRDDFDSDASFQTWKKHELSELQELLIEMIQQKPELVHVSTTTTADVSKRNSFDERRASASGLNVTHDDSSTSNLSVVGSSMEEEDHGFVFVPPDVKQYYRRLHALALEYDYDRMGDLNPDDEVSVTILLPIHETLLGECATRWRIMRTTRATHLLQLMADYYVSHDFPEASIIAGIQQVQMTSEEWDYDLWPWSDRLNLFNTLMALFRVLLERFFGQFHSATEYVTEALIESLSLVHSNRVFQEDSRDLNTVLDDCRQSMRDSARNLYLDQLDTVRQHTQDHEIVIELLRMLEWISLRTKYCDKQFPTQFLSTADISDSGLDVPALFLEVTGPTFVQHLEDSVPALIRITSSSMDDDILGLYQAITSLKKMHDAFIPDFPLVIEFSPWFSPYMQQWLRMTDAKTTEWVKRAIASDTFEAEGTDRHSSSIVDLIASCKSATEFIVDLKWPDEYENARYLTGLSQTISKSIEQYSSQLEFMFMGEMFPQSVDPSIDQDVARPSAWMTKAKLAVQGDKKVEPFVFQPESCIKLNNIQAARKLLDTMYNTLDADQVATIVRDHGPPQPVDQNEKPRSLFTVKMVLAENLVGRHEGSRNSNRLDPFLILSNPVGDRVAKTRTLYDTNDPRWDETIDLPVKGDLWLRATVYSRNLVDYHDIVGQEFVHLDPNEFGDFLPRDIWIRLKDKRGEMTPSRLLLRISMEGEKDDIQFYFGRAFRALKRTENDMTRTMVDKMSPFVRHYLSMSTLRSLVKLPAFDLDLDKVRGDIAKAGGKLNAFVRDAIKAQSTPVIPPVRDYSIPPPEMGSPALDKRKGREVLTDQQIEDPLGDLFDYFENTLGILKISLSTEACDLVISRLWKEILSTIEALIVPPLSDQRTEMKPLSEKEIDIVFKWLGFLVNYFHASGDGVALEDLRNAKYRDLVEARMFYDWPSDQLMEEDVRSMQRQFTAANPASAARTAISRNKSVYQQRNLGTIKARKIQKKQTQSTSGDMILRILRMRPNCIEFVAGQISARVSLATDQARSSASMARNSVQRRVQTRNGEGGSTRSNRVPGRLSRSTNGGNSLQR